MTWSWEYLPSEQHVTAGCPAGFLTAVEERAAELVRAAEVLYLDGTSYQGVPRLELVVVCQLTPPV
ncbi:hypothetical protein BOQ63_004740 (plasmid) [Streptomyces viridifaciens]|nr:hypothetical protein BOQ63_004740 [Streptomyces viridifaciens]